MQLPQTQSPAQLLKIPGDSISWIFFPHRQIVQAQRSFPTRAQELTDHNYQGTQVWLRDGLSQEVQCGTYIHRHPIMK